MRLENMTIEIMDESTYNRLLEIQKKHPKLTFQNDGYQYVDKSTFSEEDLAAFNEVVEILNKHVHHFIEFNNFKLRKLKNVEEEVICARFQYNWDPEGNQFIGVGYIPFPAFIYGFDWNEEKVT